MHYPVRQMSALVVACSTALMVCAQGVAASAEVLETDDAAVRRTGISLRVAALLAAAAPKYTPTAPAETDATVRTDCARSDG